MPAFVQRRTSRHRIWRLSAFLTRESIADLRVKTSAFGVTSIARTQRSDPGIFFEAAVETTEVDELGEVAFQGRVGWGEVEGICKDEEAARFEVAGGGGEEVGDELAEVGDGNAFAHGWVGDDEIDGTGIEVAEVGGDELGLDVLDFGGGEILFGDFE